MLYRENGQFKTSYRADQQIFAVRQDRIAIALLLVVAFVVVPLSAPEYLFRGILIPFLILSLAAIGLNILVGYAGEDHGLRRKANQIDYQRRILQWFGHYLKSEPAAPWITDGLSFIERVSTVFDAPFTRTARRLRGAPAHRCRAALGRPRTA